MSDASGIQNGILKGMGGDDGGTMNEGHPLNMSDASGTQMGILMNPLHMSDASDIQKGILKGLLGT